MMRLVLAIIALLVAAPAHADIDPHDTHTWATDTVCVESHVDKAWGVKGAIERWNALDGPTFVLHKRCKEYDGSVVVTHHRNASIYAGWSDWTWDTDGYLMHVEITVNPTRIKAFAPRDQQCMREHVTTHEFGHALGLRHYPRSHAGSVMSYLNWRRHCGGLSGHDRADFTHLYPTHQSP